MNTHDSHLLQEAGASEALLAQRGAGKCQASSAKRVAPSEQRQASSAKRARRDGGGAEREQGIELK